MDGAQLGAFVVFSLVGSFTPGPNTTIATATGANFGFRAVVPHVAGVPFGMTTLLVLGSLGVTGLLLALPARSEEHTSELQSRENLVCRLLLEKKKKKIYSSIYTKK